MTSPSRVGVVGLGRSGRAAARLALASGASVFATESGDSESVRDAATEVRRLGGEAETGGHTIARLAECELVVVSPGVPPDATILNDPALSDVRWTSELEFGFRHLDAPVVAVTGTNGKTTVTAWIEHLLRSAGIDAVAAGNIGTALSEVAMRRPAPEWVVVEASSYQLGRIETFAPRVGVFTNLAPDHLDRYPDVGAYYADKAHLFDNARPESTWVLNDEDPEVLALAEGVPGRRLLFRADGRPPRDEPGGWSDDAGRLLIRVDGEERVLAEPDELGLLGRHNRQNALAAALATFAVAEDMAAVGGGLRNLPALEHRLEPIGEVGGVLWVNDSKATNVASARVAVEAMDRPTVLLLGGRDKGEDYGPLAGSLAGRVRAVVAYGESAERIEAAVGERVRVTRLGSDFEAVVRHAAGEAEPGDAVLLAPACASFDMFADYEERGRRFRELVEQVQSHRAEVGHG